MGDFCLDPGGWGPVSSIRYAFTPCFQDGILAAIPPLFILVAGPAQAWQFSHSAPVPHARNWIYCIKVSVVLVLLALNVTLATIRWKESLMWQRDVMYWSAVLKVLATVFVFSLHHLEHVRNSWPVPSGVLLFYWLGTVLIDGIKLYSMIDGQIDQQFVYFVIFSVVLGGEVLIFLLEYLVPKGSRDYHLLLQGGEEDDGAEVCPADYADIFSRCNHGSTLLTIE
jgi:ATP-binding cassette, subfamily C (CFTR/MRP), member 1